jgi:hypothetical protein
MKVPLICAFVMLAFIVLGQAAMYEKAPHLAIASWSLALLATGVSLYRLRLRNRLWYGSFELLVALAASYFVSLNLYQNAALLTEELILGRMLILFGAVYVMVGALNNIGEALPPAWRLTKIWKRLFDN